MAHTRGATIVTTQPDPGPLDETERLRAERDQLRSWLGLLIVLGLTAAAGLVVHRIGEGAETPPTLPPAAGTVAGP
jgi:hypothetical protein